MWPNFVLIKIRGRLGNQLFQIAFADELRKRAKCIVLFDLDKQFVLDKFFLYPKYFKFFNSTLSFLLKRFFWHSKYKSPLIISPRVRMNVFMNPKVDVVYQGYFQSTAFFPSATILGAGVFQIRHKIIDAFRKKYEHLLSQKGNLFIHIRRTDYVNVRKQELGNSEITLPVDYYNYCMAEFSSTTKPIVISDDIEWVKKHVTWATEFIQNEEYFFDFLLMVHAEYLIISNSTFAWWAAYLNKSAKCIFAPKYFLGYNAKVEYPEGIMDGTSFKWIHH
jgi:Glycosyl transferase family 11